MSMKTWACSFLLVLAGCADDSLNRVCPYQCLGENHASLTEKQKADMEKHMGVGPCTYGQGTCDADGNLTSCEGFVGPARELCDNIDNNCNGKIDDGYGGDPLRGYGDNDVCLKFGECARAVTECVDGEFKCSYEPQEEVCNNLDDDCDARIDEDLIADFCFSLPSEEWWKATNDPCRPGLEVCHSGEWVCEGQRLPSPELCDNIDNDCNGVVDDTGDTLAEIYDIVFIIDTSGSMCGEIAAVAGALDAYVEQFEGNPNFRFAIVIMSNSGSPLVVVDTAFTDLSVVRTRLLNLGCSGSGSEDSLGSMLRVCSEYDPLGLEWRDDVIRMFFMFTDEPHQSYDSPATTGQGVVDACLQTGTLPFIWGPEYGTLNIPGGQFQNITINANGLWFPLVNDWEQIFADMNSIVITLCGGLQ